MKRWMAGMLMLALLLGLAVDGLNPAPAEAAGGQTMVRPVYGTVWQEFSGSHPGIDIAAPRGTSVYAAADGVVKEIRTGSFRGDTGTYGAGNYIVIQHSPGDSNPYRRYCPSEEWTKYLHLDAVYVKPEQSVKRGQLIATVGNTGNTIGATGYHLHFEIRVNGRSGAASNPREWIRFGYSSITGKGDIW